MTTPKRPAYRQRIGYQAGLLGGIATLAAALLMSGDISTRDAIAARQQEDLQASLEQVVPAEIHTNPLAETVVDIDVDGRPRHVYQAIRDGRVQAVAYRVTGFGYAGAIEIMLGVKANGELLGVRILAHAETPGLGDKIEAERDDWIFLFTGLSLRNPLADLWGVKKDGGVIDQFSGATITPRGVVKAIKEGLEFFQAHRASLTAIQPRPDKAPGAAQ